MRKKSEKQIFNIFRIKKVMTKDELIKLLKCTGRTVQRRLAIWQAITSYNKNSRYYTLQDIPKFDRHGIWHYYDISFSKYGNLNETVIQLIKNSDAGLTGGELGNILGLSPRSFLSPFRTNPRLCRKNINDRFVYFSAQQEQCQKQEHKRLEQEKHYESRLPSDADAVVILVEFIKHPDWSPDEIAASLQNKGKIINRNSIQRLLIYHGLEKKTKESSLKKF